MPKQSLILPILTGFLLLLHGIRHEEYPYAQAIGAGRTTSPTTPAALSPTATPIKHLIVIFNENVSFDHYFATYPHATNPRGEPAFHAAANTPAANTLEAAGLLAHNPNQSPRNGKDASPPFRLDRTQASTADQNHAYTAEQRAYDHGRADLFPRHTGQASPGGVGAFGTRGQVMGYYDGNTVTALWRHPHDQNPVTLPSNLPSQTCPRSDRSSRDGSPQYQKKVPAPHSFRPVLPSRSVS